ncbi:glycoside hydrolase family 13 protein [Panus rudis PR-1116 ss-1]|nr:glycoside hydrolase family 13 protein [Panus rudis PR-1116 ss-1]
MSIARDIIEWLRTRFTPYPTPALRTMRKGPNGDSDENPLMMQFFTWDSRHPDMSWWQHFHAEVGPLSELGVTQVWLPPPNKAMVPEGQGYDAYDLWDLGEFEQKGTTATRWGTKQQLLEAVAAARNAGIDVLIDAVLNHKLGADRTEKFLAVPVDPNNRLKDLGPPKEIEGWTAFDFPGRNGKYSELKWTHEHFSGLDWDHATKTKGVFRIVSDKHKGWSKHVDKELGNYDYLLGIDIDHRHPDVRKDLLKWGEWVLETTGASGFRLDAIKHMDRKFLLDFIRNVRKMEGRGDLFAVAEYWSANVELIKPYIRTFEGLISFFDVPLHHKFHEASKAGPAFDLRTILNGSVVQCRPQDAVTFVDNHEQIGQTLQSWVDSSFKLQAYALILLRQEGYPCVFYGDLYPNKECYDEKVAAGLRQLMLARKKFAYGIQRDYFREKNCIGFVREGNARHPGGCAVLISNSIGAHADHPNMAPHTIRMNVGKSKGSGKYRNFLDPEAQEVETDAKGWGDFTCPRGSLSVWVQVQHE